MPELPEVECLTRSVRGVLQGGVIKEALFLRPDLREPIPIERFREVVVGHRVESVLRRSKYLLVRTSFGYGVFHLGMTGNILFRTSAEPCRKHTHAVFAVTEANGSNSWLHFIDPRRFGRIDALCGDQSQLDAHAFFADLGPEPLDLMAEALGEHLFGISRGRSAPVKTFIMDQRIVVGVGNIYASEALYRAGIHPERKAGSVSRRRYDRLAATIQQTLELAIAAGGTSINDYRHINGESGCFQVELNVYDRADEPCLACGNSVRKLKQAGRSTFFCGHCQT